MELNHNCDICNAVAHSAVYDTIIRLPRTFNKFVEYETYGDLKYGCINHPPESKKWKEVIDIVEIKKNQ